MINQSKRIRLIESAGVLFHRNGINATSLADIAKDADIPIGNVYYYFKTKEELALAVVEKHREKFIAAYHLLNEAINDPRIRLIEATKTFNKHKDEYTKYGFPVIKMLDGADAKTDKVAIAAGQVFTDFVGWATQQFEKLGHSSNSVRYAISLMAALQGSIIMAKATQNPEVISDEINRLVDWLEALPNKKIMVGKVPLKA